jgi:hypothetical protein
MTLTIRDTTMASDQTAHTARHAPSRNGWEVSLLPGQLLDRNTAITAMILADLAGEEDLHEGHRLWPHIQGWGRRTRPDRIRGSSGRIPAAQRQSRARTSRQTARPGGRGLTSEPHAQDR